MFGTLKQMITSAQGGISSKIIIGSITFVILVISLIIMMFIHPEFPGLSDLISVLIITSASLLGLTTVENVSSNRRKNHPKYIEDDNIHDEI